MANTLQQASKPPENKLRYHYAMDVIEENIKQGKYIPGYKLPPIKRLADDLGLNFLTVRKAIHKLTEKGLLEVKPGVGTFVADFPRKSDEKTINIILACRKYTLEVTQHHPAIGAYLAGAHKRLNEPKYNVQAMFYGEGKFLEDLGDRLLDSEAYGVIITGAGMRQKDWEFLKANKIFVVDVSGEKVSNNWVIKIRTDTESVLRNAIEHLRSLGHRRIGFITYERTPNQGKTSRIYADLAFEHQLGNPKELTVLVSNPEGHPHWEDVEDFFKISPLPTAVVVADEFIADVLLVGCDRRGIKVPDDLSIVAQQDLLPYGHRIPLTAVDGVAHSSELIYRACDILANLADGKPIEQRELVVVPKLIVKASTGPVKKD